MPIATKVAMWDPAARLRDLEKAIEAAELAHPESAEVAEVRKRLEVYKQILANPPEKDPAPRRKRRVFRVD